MSVSRGIGAESCKPRGETTDLGTLGALLLVVLLLVDPGVLVLLCWASSSDGSVSEVRANEGLGEGGRAGTTPMQGTERRTVLGHEVLHVRLGLGELHLVHALARVPVEERAAAEHGRELRVDALEQGLDRRRVADEGDGLCVGESRG